MYVQECKINIVHHKSSTTGHIGVVSSQSKMPCQTDHIGVENTCALSSITTGPALTESHHSVLAQTNSAAMCHDSMRLPGALKMYRFEYYAPVITHFSRQFPNSSNCFPIPLFERHNYENTSIAPYAACTHMGVSSEPKSQQLLLWP